MGDIQYKDETLILKKLKIGEFSVKLIDNPEWIEVLVDKDNKIIEGIRKDNSHFPPYKTSENKKPDEFDYDDLKKNTIVSSYNNTDIDVKLADFASHFAKTSQRIEPFLFFTDPHLFFKANTEEGLQWAELQDAMSLVQKAYNKSAAKFVLCGGDWLTAHPGTEPYTYLSWVDGVMNSLFNDKYYMVFGNHDNNYQAEWHFPDDDNILSNQEVVNLMFARYGSNEMYYSFFGNSTRFYVLDSGLDNAQLMSEYRWRQIDWLANNLLQDNDADVAIAMHITNSSLAATPMADNVTKVCQAYNSKSTVTLNGITYNFSNCRGTVHFIIAGHNHADYSLLVNDIPIIGTKNLKPGYVGTNVTFDLVFADYSKHKMYLTRIGEGSDRIIDIV